LLDDFPVFRSAISVLTQVSAKPTGFSRREARAAFALGAIGDESAIPVLQANLANAIIIWQKFAASLCGRLPFTRNMRK
jgi:hypothetical protein